MRALHIHLHFIRFNQIQRYVLSFFHFGPNAVATAAASRAKNLTKKKTFAQLMYGLNAYNSSLCVTYIPKFLERQFVLMHRISTEDELRLIFALLLQNVKLETTDLGSNCVRQHTTGFNSSNHCAHKIIFTLKSTHTYTHNIETRNSPMLRFLAICAIAKALPRYIGED